MHLFMIQYIYLWGSNTHIISLPANWRSIIHNKSKEIKVFQCQFIAQTIAKAACLLAPPCNSVDSWIRFEFCTQPYGMHIHVCNVTSSTDRYSIFQLHSRVHTHTHTHTLGSGVYANARSYQTPWSMSSDLHTDTHTH